MNWIDVKTELPLDNTFVQCKHSNETEWTNYLFYANDTWLFFHTEGCWWSKYDKLVKDITHWRVLDVNEIPSDLLHPQTQKSLTDFIVENL